MEGQITVSRGENARIRALTELEAGRLSVEEVALALDRSVRQVWRLLARFRAEGAAGICHGNRGRRPPNACEVSLGDRVVDLARTTYAGFNQQQFSEVLAADEGILLSRSTVRRMLAEAGIAAPRPQRRSRHRRRRLREGREGALLQLDGSFHDWLEGRGPKLTLVGAVDDATGHMWAVFTEREDLEGYFALLRGIVTRQGIPGAVYTDRHTMFLGSRVNAQGGRKTYETQFSRLLDRLGVVHIRAGSPQAKGRIERLWKTLQDRLVSQLRAKQVATLVGANRELGYYVERHNRILTVPARDPDPAWRPLDPTLDLDELFARVETRVVRNDNTVVVYGTVLQLPPRPDGSGYARSRIEVRRCLNGEVRLFLAGSRLPATTYNAA
jgi:transposase